MCDKINTVYQNISGCINIDSEREKYTKLYDAVRKLVIDNLKENVYFKSLFSDIHLCGSYADNLKITKPDEFDLVMRFKFPQNDQVKIIPDKTNKGNVILSLSTVLQKLKESKNENMLQFLNRLVNDKGYFLENKFQCWLQGCFDKFMIKIGKQLIIDEAAYPLVYCRKGPAHTVKIDDDGNDSADGCIRISIDFVPGFVFDVGNAKTSRKITKSWEAIPKPIKRVSNNPSFRCSYTDSERDIFRNLNQFKNTLRIVKKLRDMQPKLEKFKSYYIKTLFLWQTERSSADFWSLPTVEIINVMLSKWEETLKEGKLEYFWDPGLNLLNDLARTQIDSMYHDLRLVKKSLQCCLCGKNIYDVFLKKDEQDRMSLIKFSTKKSVAADKESNATEITRDTKEISLEGEKNPNETETESKNNVMELQEDWLQMQLENYGKKLRNMSPAQRLYADNLIYQILSEGERNNLMPDTDISKISITSTSYIGHPSSAVNRVTDRNPQLE